MNETRRKPTTGRKSPSLPDKWHGSRVCVTGHIKDQWLATRVFCRENPPPHTHCSYVYCTRVFCRENPPPHCSYVYCTRVFCRENPPLFLCLLYTSILQGDPPPPLFLCLLYTSILQGEPPTVPMFIVHEYSVGRTPHCSYVYCTRVFCRENAPLFLCLLYTSIL